MKFRQFNKPLRRLDIRSSLYAALFLVCAVVSASGAGLAGLLLFAPGALAVDHAMERRGEGRNRDHRDV
jgi:hypothetical protein